MIQQKLNEAYLFRIFLSSYQFILFLIEIKKTKRIRKKKHAKQFL